ncbi:TPA: hypothetical protein IAA68_00510 [Candidatus Galligastranaerophilus faecipullorum]|nr:hypothetical protein [Candidatus Galligastranaerophilus faecipullorum]
MIIKKRLKTSNNQSKAAKQQILEAPAAELLADKTPEVSTPVPARAEEKQITEQDTLKEFEKIDISEIEFKERIERRRGDRRRGYRRIDERALVSRAQEEARSIRELAAKEGYKNGLENAQKEIDKLKAALEDFLSSRYKIYDELMPHILEISLEVAKKIIKKEVELSPDVLKNIINEVLGELSSAEEKITIRTAPDDVDFARASLPEIIETNRLDAKVVIVPDEAVEKGSCIVISNNGVVDANFSTQLQIIQNAFGIYKGGQ